MNTIPGTNRNPNDLPENRASALGLLTIPSLVGSCAAYGIAHAAVDFACAALIFQILITLPLPGTALLIMVLLYNLLAFAGQPLVGLWIDRFARIRSCATIGITITAAGVACVHLAPWMAVALAGLGNAVFHVAGGVISLNLRPGKAAFPGIVIAPGAIGLMAGGVVGRSGPLPVPIVLAILGACLVIVFFAPLPRVTNTPEPLAPVVPFPGLILLLLFSIAIRSMVGLSAGDCWGSRIDIIWMLVFAAALGKALGGILSDRMDWITLNIGALLVSVPLFLAGRSLPLLLVTGMFFFQMTMPATLVALANILPGRSGFAFGLACLALVCGALPALIFGKAPFASPWLIVSLTLLSAAALYQGLKLLPRALRGSR
jgi:FSR family fosmidomycin resistance protein-like MFS transporter